jgi:LacI family transcriptional regulator
MQMMVLKAAGPEAKIESTRRLLSEGRVDGLILMVDQMSGGAVRQLENPESPIVVLDEDVGHRHLDNVLVDNCTGGRDATQHLIEMHGIRNLVFLGGPEDNIDSRDRARGFSDALAAAGIEDQPEMYLTAPYDFGAGFERVQEIIPRLSGGPRWGLVAANDDLALGAMAAVQRAGLEVPDDVAVVGYDDSHLARFGSPQLSSVRVPLKEVGRTAVRMILEWLRDERREPTTVILKPRLVARQSCGCDPELLPVLTGAEESEEGSP